MKFSSFGQLGSPVHFDREFRDGLETGYMCADALDVG